MKQIAIAAILAALSLGGEINIVQLGPADEVRIEVSCGEARQVVALSHGGATGPFILPEEEASIRLSDLDVPALVIPGGKEPHIAILAQAEEGADSGYRWILIPAKPNHEKWAMRAINLTKEAITIEEDGGTIELQPDAPTDIPVTRKPRITLGDSFTYQGNEPCAVIALIHRINGEWNVLFIPEG